MRTRWSRQTTFLAASLVAAAGGCSGDPTSDANPSDDEPSNPGDPGPDIMETLGPSAPTPVGCRLAETIAPSPAIVRLSHSQYRNSLRDLFGELPTEVERLPVDPRPKEAFGNEANGLSVSDDLGKVYRQAAESLAGRLLANAEKALELAGCATPAPSCGDTFVSQFGRRAFRRPLSEAQTARYLGLFKNGHDEELAVSKDAARAVAAGVRIVVEAMLQSPMFTYRIERGTAQDSSDGRLALDGFEVASRLSFALWGTAPDQELLDEARDGKLTTLADARRQIDRLLASPRALDAVTSFHDELMGTTEFNDLSRDVKKHPAFAGVTSADLEGEISGFVTEVFKADGDLDDLLTARFTVANAKLAALYKVPAPPGGKFARVDLSSKPERAGLLTQIGTLSSRAHFDITSPIERGAFVLRNFACVEFPPPPAGAAMEDPVFGPGITVREAFTDLTKGAACVSCHRAINAAGFAFERFDIVGQVQSTDAGETIDDTGELDILETPIPYKGPVQLIEGLAKAPETRACYVRHWRQFFAGEAAGDVDACQVETLAAELEKGASIKTLMARTLDTPSLLVRQPVLAEGAKP